MRNVLALFIFLLGVSPMHAAQPLTKVIMDLVDDRFVRKLEKEGRF